MIHSYAKKGLAIFTSIIALVVIYSCASVGMPNGGPYDETPPKFLSSTPPRNQTNYKHTNIELVFDELIQLDNPSENVIITPPQLQMPIVRASGKKVNIELKDTLQENTTYTFDFTNSLSDNNEKNVLENFTYAFSTGNVIDTLEVSGILLNAENLEPMPGITIGLHRDLHDSAFVKKPFSRTSRTNDKGHFTIRNISPGEYHIFALKDMNRDYKFDQVGEDIAFSDSLIVPSFKLAMREDTTWVDSLTVDTIRIVEYTHYLPDNIELLLFKEKFERQYMLRPERSQEKMFTLRFNAPLDTVPLPTLLNDITIDSSWYFIQTADEGKTINFWLTDSLVWKQDTISFAVTYPKSDSLNVLRPQIDTLHLAAKKVTLPKKPKKGEEEIEKIDFLPMIINGGGTVNTFDTISITFEEPVLTLTKEHIFLNQKVDTTWVPTDFELLPDSINSLKYIISRRWNYGEEYLLEVDSATIFSLYGKWNNSFSETFKIKAKDEYGNLYINIEGISTPAYVELLNTADDAVRKVIVKDGGVLFMDLKPDKYYARLVVDTNNNGKWDTGNYAEKRQAEQVFYSPNLYNVMQNWDVEETWDVTSTPLSKQKPLEITKNKPKEASRKKRDYKNEGQQKQSSGTSGQGMGFPF